MAWVITAKRYLVTLRPIGINYRSETAAGSPSAAVGHVLYYYLGKSRERLQERLMRLHQELGEEGWTRKVSEMADEIVSETPMEGDVAEPPAIDVPPPVEVDEQLRLFEFQKDSNKNHPAATAADYWKKTNTMKFVDFDKLEEIMAEGEAAISVKLDGELVALSYANGKVETVTAKGTVRSGMPPTEEAAQLLSAAGIKEAIFMAEMYAVDENGRPQSYMKSSSILKNPDKAMDHLIRLSVFDVISIDGRSYEAASIQDKMKEIERIFGKGKSVHAAQTVTGTIEIARELWDQLQDKGWEGLVVHVGDKLYKTKPILSFDMVVVAVSKSQKVLDRVGAMLTALIDKEGLFRLTGEIGGGLNDEDRAELMNWAERNKVAEDDEHIWVDPFKEPLIVEVEAVEVNPKMVPKMQFKDKKWVKIEDDWGGTLRFPQFVRYREDKEPKHPDVRVEQLPLEQQAKIMTYNLLQAYERIGPGKHIKVITGQTGRVLDLVPRSGDSGMDFDVIVEWDSPLWGEVSVCEVHPTEVVEVWD